MIFLLWLSGVAWLFTLAVSVTLSFDITQWSYAERVALTFVLTAWTFCLWGVWAFKWGVIESKGDNNKSV